MISFKELVEKYELNRLRFEKVVSKVLEALLIKLDYRIKFDPYLGIRHIPNTVYNMLAPIYGWEPVESGEVKRINNDLLFDSGELFFVSGKAIMKVDEYSRDDTFSSGNRVFIRQYGYFREYLTYQPGDDLDIKINNLKIKAKSFRILKAMKRANFKVNGKQWIYKRYSEYVKDHFVYGETTLFEITKDMIDGDAGVFKNWFGVLFEGDKIKRVYCLSNIDCYLPNVNKNKKVLLEITPPEPVKEMIFALEEGKAIKVEQTGNLYSAGKIPKSTVKTINKKYKIRKL